MIQIVNFSGGKDSTAMLHLMLERGEQIDDVVFFDGGWDWPQMYDHLDEVERKAGIKISRVKPDHDFNWYLYEFERNDARYGFRNGYGWPGVRLRWCTRLKVDTIKNYLKCNYLFQDVVNCVGYAVGEERRAERKSAKARGYRYPLIEWNYDELDCKKYCYSLGYTFGGLYEYFDRVSCFCCPLQSKKELFLKKRHFPDVWAKLMEMDHHMDVMRRERNQEVPRTYRPDESLLQIDSKLRGKD